MSETAREYGPGAGKHDNDLSKSSFGSKLLKGLGLAGAGMAIGLGARIFQCQSFSDVPGNEDDFGRTVNSLSSLITGVVTKQIKENGVFDGTIEKPFYADAAVHAGTTAGSIDSLVDLTFSSAHFRASGPKDNLIGDVDKTEFNWKIKQESPTRWHIGRFGLKWDKELEITAANGEIHGVLRQPMAWDWTISGTYDEAGNVRMHIGTSPAKPSFDITGTIK